MTRELADGDIVFGMKVNPIDFIHSGDDPCDVGQDVIDVDYNHT